MSQALFVTGTDTGVGKTVVACALLRALRREGVAVGALKPAETDWAGPPDRLPSDAAALARAAGLELPREAVVPYALPEPLAPAVAARWAGVTIDPEVLDRALAAQRARSRLVVVEGAGGLLVPLTDELTMADLAVRWNMPLLVVARPGLGTINHTALTVEAARVRGLRVLGVVISGWPAAADIAAETNPAEIERLTRAPLLGRLPWSAQPESLDAAEYLDLAPVRALLEEA